MRRASYRSRTGRPTARTRRARRAKGKRWHILAERDKSCAAVEARLRAEGPLTANELGGAKKGGPWWDWSETKIAAEWLLDIGVLVCRERRGFQRVYDLAERAIPPELQAQEWTRRAVRHATRRRGRAIPRRVHGGRPGGVSRAAAAAGPAGTAQHGPGPGRRGGVAAARVRRPLRPRVARRAGAPSEPSPFPLRLPDLVPRPRGAAVRCAPSARGLHAEGKADLWLLRHARAGGHEDRRAGGPGPP